MERKIYTDLEQGTDEWFQVRLGRATASEFQTIMSKGRGSAPSKGRRTYMLKLMGERLTGRPMDSYNNFHMERGKAQEHEARLAYELTTGVEVQQVGFVAMGDDIGCSPDGLVNSDGMCEIKCRLEHIQLELLLAQKDGKAQVPPENMAQCQGGLWVAEREWIDYVSYCPDLEPVIIRVQRDEKAIMEISMAVKKFLAEMNELLEKLK